MVVSITPKKRYGLTEAGWLVEVVFGAVGVTDVGMGLLTLIPLGLISRGAHFLHMRFVDPGDASQIWFVAMGVAAIAAGVKTFQITIRREYVNAGFAGCVAMVIVLGIHGHTSSRAAASQTGEHLHQIARHLEQLRMAQGLPLVFYDSGYTPLQSLLGIIPMHAPGRTHLPKLHTCSPSLRRRGRRDWHHTWAIMPSYWPRRHG